MDITETLTAVYTENEHGSFLARDSGVTRPEILTSNSHTLAGRRRYFGDHVPIASGRKSAKLKEAVIAKVAPSSRQSVAVRC